MRILPTNTPPAPVPSGGGSPRQQATLRRDAATQQALSAIVNSSEQSYEQFLHGFSHLTAADVAPAIIQGGFGGSEVSAIHMGPFGISVEPSTRVDSSGASDDPPLCMAPVQPARLSPPPIAPMHGGGSVDELEEHVLDVSSDQTSSLSSTIDPPPKRILKLDNFVDDEDVAATDEDEGFERDLESVGSEYIASFSASSESPAPTDECFHLSSPLSITSCSSTTLNKVHSINIVNHATPYPRECGDELEYDPHQDLPNPGEVMDDEVDETPASRASSVAMVTNIRAMTYSAREAGPGEKPSCQHTDVEMFEAVDSEVGSDEVEPFSLDDEFDYDNVVLTPKFTPQEQAKLKEHARRGKVEKEDAMRLTQAGPDMT